MRKKKRFYIACAIAAVLAAAVTFSMVWLHNWPAKHFGAVKEGVLYRGGQPGAKGLGYIVQRYKVRTVVNLRGAYPEQDWWRAEREICRKNGVRMVDVSIDNYDTVVSGLKQFLAVATDSANGPVYVHCELGRARTGYVIAAYRIVAQGWSYDQAIQEARDCGFNIRFDTDREYDAVLRQLGGGMNWRNLPDRPTSTQP